MPAITGSAWACFIPRSTQSSKVERRSPAHSARNPAAIGAVIELVIHRLSHRLIEVFGQNVHGEAAFALSISWRTEFSPQNKPTALRRAIARYSRAQIC